jgi:uncharacterized protein
MRPNSFKLLSVILALVVQGLAQPQASLIPSDPQKLKKEIESGIEFSIVGNTRVIQGPWHVRGIAVFVESESFTLENIRTISVHLSEEYPLEDSLGIEAISNEEQLGKTERGFADIRSYPFGNVMEERFRCGNGYEPAALSASYHRSNGSESLYFYPANGGSVHVDLKPPFIDCTPTGDTSEDFLDAATRGCEDVVEKLLNAGADPNVKTRHGGAVLVEASYRGNTRIVRQLLERGADINQTSASGWTPLIAAVYRNRSCVSGLSCLIDLLLTRGADINARAEDGRTALGYAVFRQNADAVKKLLECGADVSSIDGYGKTALAMAEDQHDANIARLLREAGAIQ